MGCLGLKSCEILVKKWQIQINYVKVLLMLFKAILSRFKLCYACSGVLLLKSWDNKKSSNSKGWQSIKYKLLMFTGVNDWNVKVLLKVCNYDFN